MTKQNIKFYAIPNGGRRDLREAVKFKRMGTIPGVPDICIPIPSGSYHGLYIELKRTHGGRLSQAQSEWLDFLSKKGYYAIVAAGFDQARDAITYYFSLTKPAA